MTRAVLRLLLLENYYAVVGEAGDGEKVVELCVGLRPDLVFIDINMPKVNGHEAAQQIKQRSPGTGIIMISSLPTLNNVKQAMQVGASGFVVKPFNAVKVIEAIDQCLKNNQ